MKRQVLCIALLSFFLTACVNLDPVEDDLQMYALGSVSDRPETEFPEETENVVYIARPDLPAYLSNNRILIRSADGEIKHLGGIRWVEPLEEGVARALSEYISRANGQFVAGYYPWPRLDRKTPQVRVRFSELSFEDDGSIHVVAFWWESRDEEVLKGGVFEPNDIAWTPGEPATLVTAFNEILEALGNQIAAKRE
ncbi:MAG: PqiC family protein [Coraliomargarita sp.]